MSERPVIPMRSPTKCTQRSKLHKVRITYGLDDSDDGISGIPKLGGNRDVIPSDPESSYG